jgi:hypothetical protein
MESPNGHDAFLKDWDQLNPIVAAFVARSEATSIAGRSCTNHGSPP